MNEQDFNRLKESVKQAKAIMRGELASRRGRLVESPILAKSAREKLGMTQEQFAATPQTSVSTVRSWEQGKRTPTPTPATRLLLKVAHTHPAEVLECV